MKIIQKECSMKERYNNLKVSKQIKVSVLPTELRPVHGRRLLCKISCHGSVKVLI